MADSIAVLGTGIMGAPMARNLANAGFDVTAWNRTAQKARALESDGVRVVGTAPEAVESAGWVLTMLADGPAVHDVMVERGALATMSGGAAWLQMSTVGVDWCDRLGRAAAERGAVYVDAPVLGTRKPAEDGALTILGSGPEDAEDWCEQVFDAVGRRTMWLGEAGRGTRLKLVVNNWIVGLLGALGESIALAEALDLDPHLLLDAIGGGPLDAGYAHVKGEAMMRREFPPSFPLRLALKDARLVDEAARERGLDLAISRAVAGRFEAADGGGHGDEDMAAILHGILSGG
ncbi:MAG: NAD(P)-dependent oxidoreductase [Myxococcota bacterium]